jgi:hypothetical protein
MPASSKTDGYHSTTGGRPVTSNYGSVDVFGTELSVTWRDKIGEDFNYYVKVNTGYGDNKILVYPWEDARFDEQVPNQRDDRGLWGYECMGMFKSRQEIAEYFDMYLKKDDGTYGTYLGNDINSVYPGMLIYRDVRGKFNSETNSYDPNPDHQVDSDDYIQLSKRSSNPWGFTMNFGGEWKGLSFNAQIGVSWGSYSLVPDALRSVRSLISTESGYSIMQYTNLPAFWANNTFLYQDVIGTDLEGNEVVLAEQNLDAKYPSLFYSGNSSPSSFWMISGAQATLKNATLAYSLPKKWVNKLGIESCRFNLTAQNLLSLYNPLKKYNYDPLMGSYGNYPVLRKVTLGVSLSF